MIPAATDNLLKEAVRFQNSQSKRGSIVSFAESALFHLSELRQDGADHRHEACGAAHAMGDGFRYEDPPRAHAEDGRQQEGEGNDDDDLAEDGKKDRLALFVECLEGCLSADLQSLEDEGEKVHVQGRDCLFQDTCV